MLLSAPPEQGFFRWGFSFKWQLGCRAGESWSSRDGAWPRGSEPPWRVVVGLGSGLRFVMGRGCRGWLGEEMKGRLRGSEEESIRDVGRRRKEKRVDGAAGRREMERRVAGDGGCNAGGRPGGEGWCQERVKMGWPEK
ncbi:hypothetical protein OIU74_024330, partial [Salix koriyanagi]